MKPPLQPGDRFEIPLVFSSTDLALELREVPFSLLEDRCYRALEPWVNRLEARLRHRRGACWPTR